MTTGISSFARRTSNSIPSAPSARARLNAARVFSGATMEEPRCAMIRGGLFFFWSDIKNFNFRAAEISVGRARAFRANGNLIIHFSRLNVQHISIFELKYAPDTSYTIAITAGHKNTFTILLNETNHCVWNISNYDSSAKQKKR